ncbi:hypothetical protein BASA50_007905 [Batrachochytrium salamandrivorans]|uniref:RNA polymerase II degradation factor 1 n=1 Tax=Batrachochytrium salamandrivorans TaxID=1357716 RepID=A0ABQ8F678_9FUNG|nr:hypothetical protein BASA60_002278 [Batrachochytrium salamandrivorans]KAH6592726.1 hypothetical protein BASA50_007905 [Batrachochytrium salamandrivorans]KAH6602338.1 hypothetical protein BASA61_001212 [Batrachochytrium salamandrivorans]KAH9271208.1 hypothetical protein BASA83_006526 [Batrachochytrium salamandrivorans]
MHSSNNSTHTKSLDLHAQELKSRYSTELRSLRDIFAEWSEVDLLYILGEVQGDFDLAVSRITEGHAEQWGEVKSSKKKEKLTTVVPSSTAGTTSLGTRQRPSSDSFSVNDRSSGVHHQYRGGARASGDSDAPAFPRGGSASRGGRGGSRGGGRGGGRGGRGGGRPVSDRPIADASKPVGATSTSAWDTPIDTTEQPPPTESKTALSGDWDMGSEATGVGAWATHVAEKIQPATVAAPTPPNAKSAGTASAKHVASVQLATTPSRTPQPKASWAQLVRGPEPVVAATPEKLPKQHNKPKSTVKPKNEVALPAAAAAATTTTSAATSETVTMPTATPVHGSPIAALKAKTAAASPMAKSASEFATTESSVLSAEAVAVIGSASSTPAHLEQQPVAVPAHTSAVRSPATAIVKPTASASAVAPALAAATTSSVSATLPSLGSTSAGLSHAGDLASTSGNISNSTAPPGLRHHHSLPRSQAPRKLKQDQAVVMPSNAQLGSIGVQFGSLRIGNMDLEADASPSFGSGLTTTEKLPLSQAQQQQQQQQHSSPLHSQQSHQQQQHTASSRIISSTTSPAASAASASVPAAAPYSRHHHQSIQQQQQQPEPDHSSSAAGLYQHAAAPAAIPGAPGLPGVIPYAPYFHGQPGNAFGHHGTLPTDYNPYAPDQARAAAFSMGYYPPVDPASYAHGVPNAKHIQDAHAVSSQVSPQQQHMAVPHQTTMAGPQTTLPNSQTATHQHLLQQQQQHPQNGYHPAYGYFPYYVQNQFPGGYQNAGHLYGQQFVGKSVYPGYVQPTPASSTPGSVTSGIVPTSSHGTAGQSNKTANAVPAGLSGALAGSTGGPIAGSLPVSASANYPYQAGQPNFYQYEELNGGISGMQQMDYGKSVNGYGSAPQSYGGFAPNSLGSAGKSNEFKPQNRQSRPQYETQKYTQQQQQQHAQQHSQQQQNSPSNSGQPLQNPTVNGSGHATPGAAAQTAQLHSAPAYYNQHHQVQHQQQHQFQGNPHPGYQPHLMHHQQQHQHQQYPNNGGYNAGSNGQQRQGYWAGQN